VASNAAGSRVRVMEIRRGVGSDGSSHNRLDVSGPGLRR